MIEGMFLALRRSMILNNWIRNIYNWLGRIGLTKPSVIVTVDGGLCSQMYQFLLGEMIRKKGQNVEYNLDFFKTGLDLNNNPTRLFLISRLFPSFTYKKASHLKVLFYKLFFRYIGKHPKEVDKSWLEKNAPVILQGYYTPLSGMFKTGGPFTELWKIDFSNLSTINKETLKRIQLTQSVGVHIRRGDLATYNSAYGAPVTNEYVSKGLQYFVEKRNKPVFYFFSDEPEFIINELIPSLKLEIEYEVVVSSQDKVDEDFILLSNCKDLIASKGTMGKYAAIYGNSNTIVVSYDDKQGSILEDLSCKKVFL